jgi:hypothetical protein
VPSAFFPEYDVRLKILVTFVALLIGVGTPAFAAPLDGNQVAADAKWVAHIDLDAAKTATLAEKVLSWWLSNELVRQQLAAVKMHTGVDLVRDLHGVTFYGSRLAQNTGVVIVHANFDANRLLRIVRGKPDYNATRFDNHTLHTWTERKDTSDKHTVTGCVFAPELLIVGRDSAEVKAALDVLDGKSAALAGSDSPLAGEVPEGAIVVAGVTGVPEAGVPFKSPIVNQSEFIWVALGEQDGEVFGQLKFVAKSDEAAEQVEDILRGLRAMALLQLGSDKEARKIIARLTVARSQRTVHVEWRGAAAGVWRLLEQELKKR